MLTAPVLVASHAAGRGACWLDVTGEAEEVDAPTALARAATGAPLVCHAPATFGRLGGPVPVALDILELFAFVHPARFCLPTPAGLAGCLGLPAPHSLAEAAQTIYFVARRLLAGLAGADAGAIPIARAMAQRGWAWGPAVCDALARRAGEGAADPAAGEGLNRVWRRLPEWEAAAGQRRAGNEAITPDQARRRLAALLGDGSESRPQQADYASAVTGGFQAATGDGPALVLAEAGTGTGKTLGYVAVASLWAERNDNAVWLSTYTRNLQRQLAGDLRRLYPDPARHRARAVTRKGRENYLCLLNLEEAAGRMAVLPPARAVALGLLLRWTGATVDGDMGGDLPAWLADLTGGQIIPELADRRGECVFTACSHYSRCFVERSSRRARSADLVIANHALVLSQAVHAGAGPADPTLPTRYVFDEGHHLFDAADSVFATSLTGRETADLRRWILGLERQDGRRSRGLADRIADLLDDDSDAPDLLQALLQAARVLPGPGWTGRLGNRQPAGGMERFLDLVRAAVYARAPDPDSPYDLEADTAPVDEAMAEAATALADDMDRMARAMARLRHGLAALLEASPPPASSRRIRLEAAMRGLARRGAGQVGAWATMLRDLPAAAPAGAQAGVEADTPDDTPDAGRAGFADWFGVRRQAGRDVDVGLYRHWIDPMQPFAEIMDGMADAMVVTSATLTDRSGDPVADWQVAERTSGAAWLARPALRVRLASPFDHAAQTRILVVSDLHRAGPVALAAACRDLFLAAGGGALGLFTAIARLRDVHRRLAGPLAAAGLPLYAQHVDRMNVATLIDMFRADPDSCLLGTDAVRDGVDVPGRSLRLLVMDRVPWPRPSILHRARRRAFGGSAWSDSRTRFRLAQAYGRLIRRDSDRGVFVLLDPRLPSRLASAFPANVPVQRLPLAEAIPLITTFLVRCPARCPARCPG